MGAMAKQRFPGDDGVASPCIGICQMDPLSRLCSGCRRTIDEIAAWSIMSADEKRRVLAELPRRRS